MYIKPKIFISNCAIVILTFIILGILAVNAQSEKRVLESKVNALETQISYSSIATMPALKVNIAYTKGSKTHKFDTYDNLIDVGNEIINKRLTEAIYRNRVMEFICPNHELEIEVHEEDNTASVFIHWSESMEMFSVEL